jgi:hypothetical protein
MDVTSTGRNRTFRQRLRSDRRRYEAILEAVQRFQANGTAALRLVLPGRPILPIDSAVHKPGKLLRVRFSTGGGCW